MSEQQGQSDQLPSADTKPKGPDDREPTPERQAKLREAYEANLATGEAPYAGVEICTRGELRWVMQERRWSGEYDYRMPEGYERADLSGAGLVRVNLSGTYLIGADLSKTNLVGADLSRAYLNEADLSGANLWNATLSGADFHFATLSGADLHLADLSAAVLFGTNLSGADLEQATLSGPDLTIANLSRADLRGASLSGARLSGAFLTGADLRKALMDATTRLSVVLFDTHTLMADVVWNGVPLTRLDWQDLAMLGEEQVARQPKEDNGERKGTLTRLREYGDAVLANRQVATVLRSQGLNEHADRFAYRAQLCQRIVSRRQHHYLRYIGSLLLGLLAGYGYRPGRAILLYLAVIVWFANLYVFATHGVLSFGLAPSQCQPLPWYEALVLSVSSFHGRGFLPFPNLGDPVTILAAIEAVFGLIIEVSFIATFTQRFFAR